MDTFIHIMMLQSGTKNFQVAQIMTQFIYECARTNDCSLLILHHLLFSKQSFNSVVKMGKSKTNEQKEQYTDRQNLQHHPSAPF